MRIFEGQVLGALALLLGSIAIYGISLFNARQPVRESSIPWGQQGAGVTTVEIAGDPRKEGVYFLPEGTTWGKLHGMGLVPAMLDIGRHENARICAGSVFDISANGDVKTVRMADAKRLALGLPVNLNRVSEEDLMLIPGIGERMARRIIQLRNRKGALQDLSELMAIPGVGERKLNGLREYLITADLP
jgi:competence protein ComEA